MEGKEHVEADQAHTDLKPPAGYADLLARLPNMQGKEAWDEYAQMSLALEVLAAKEPDIARQSYFYNLRGDLAKSYFYNDKRLSAKYHDAESFAQAEAELSAAKSEASQRVMLADAQAYEIRKINEAVASNPAYIQLQALEALKAISKNPSSKIYFINGDSPMPLPLMHMGESTPAVRR